MPRGYRGAILAVVGWLILCGQAPEKTTQPDKANAAQPIPKPVPAVAPPSVQPVETVQPPEYERPCGKDRDNRNSDLCAQWKAADAAEEAADWAARSFWVGVLGFLGLMATLYYTRAAVRLALETSQDAEAALAIAERNANYAMSHVEVAQATSRGQLRPYLSVVVDKEAKEWTPYTEIAFHIKNFGQTPAQNVRIRFGVEFCERPINDRSASLIDSDEIPDIAPQDDPAIILKLADLSEHQWHRLAAEGWVMIFRIVVAYEGFGIEAETIESEWIGALDDRCWGQIGWLNRTERTIPHESAQEADEGDDSANHAPSPERG